MGNSLSAENPGIWLRANQAGYTPERDKTAVVLSEIDISGAAWKLYKEGKTVLAGVLSPGGTGDDFHISLNHHV